MYASWFGGGPELSLGGFAGTRWDSGNFGNGQHDLSIFSCLLSRIQEVIINPSLLVPLKLEIDPEIQNIHKEEHIFLFHQQDGKLNIMLVFAHYDKLQLGNEPNHTRWFLPV